MTTPARVGRWLVPLALAVYVFHLFDAIVADRALFSDGAQFFVELLTKHGGWRVADDAKHPRLFVNALNQLPAITALWLGSADLLLVRRLFGAGLFLTAPIALAWSAWISHRAGDWRLFRWFAAAAVCCSISAELFVINQALTAAALAWLALHYVLLTIRWRWYDVAIATVCGLVLLQSHQGMILWGSILALAALWRARDVRSSAPQTALGLAGVAVAATSVAAWMWWWTRVTPLQHEVQSFAASWWAPLYHAVRPGPAQTAVWQCVGMLGIAISALSPTARHWRWCGMALISAAVLGLLGNLSLAIANPSALDAQAQFEDRVIIPFGHTAFMALAVLYRRFRSSERGAVLEGFRLMVAGSAIVATSWQVANTSAWRAFAGTARLEVADRPAGTIEPAVVRAAMRRQGQIVAERFATPWQWSVLGLALQDQPTVRHVLLPELERASVVLPQASGDVLRVPYVTLRPGAPFQLDTLVAACGRGTCRFGPEVAAP